jgi:16S rRNA (guanine527-N7)-methyltransferase
MRDEFAEAVESNQSAYNVRLSLEIIDKLAGYYELIQEHNPLLHLVAPCSPEEFATRHILESLTLLEYLPQNARFADVGAGAGLPSIPCLIARDDLSAVLIESKEKKAKYLEIAVEKLGLSHRVKIENRQFEEVKPEGFSYVTCRALDKFTEKLPKLLKWSGKRKLLLFAGDGLRPEIEKAGRAYKERLMPLSEKRYLFALS